MHDARAYRGNNPHLDCVDPGGLHCQRRLQQGDGLLALGVAGQQAELGQAQQGQGLRLVRLMHLPSTQPSASWHRLTASVEAGMRRIRCDALCQPYSQTLASSLQEEDSI